MADISKQLQKHPREKVDRIIVDRLLTIDYPEPIDQAELARLRIRYRGFPGAKSIQHDLDSLLAKWHLTEEELFAFTRDLHQGEPIYQVKAKKNAEQEDWN